MPTTYIVVPVDDSTRQASPPAILDRLGLELVGRCADPASAVDLVRLLRPTLVIVEAAGEPAAALEAAATLNRLRLAPVVLLSDSSDSALDRDAALAGIMAHLPLTCSPEAVSAALEVALARWRDLIEIERKLAKLEARLKDRILIEQAKGILMQRQPGLTEQQAYARMRTLSMRTRKPMREVAAAIVLSAEAEEDPESADEQPEDAA